MGCYWVRLGGAGHLSFRSRRVSRTRRKGPVTVAGHRICSERLAERSASDLEKTVLRSRQAEMIAQRCPLIVAAEQAALLQNRHHELHESLKTFVEIRRHHVETNGRPIHEP